MKCCEKVNVIRVVPESQVSAILSRIVRALLCFLSLVSNLRQASHRWSSRFIVLIVSAYILALADRRDDATSDFLLLVMNELLQNVPIVVVHALVIEALVHFSQLLVVDRRPCERLWTTIERHVARRLVSSSDHS